MKVCSYCFVGKLKKDWGPFHFGTSQKRCEELTTPNSFPRLQISGDYKLIIILTIL